MVLFEVSFEIWFFWKNNIYTMLLRHIDTSPHRDQALWKNINGHDWFKKMYMLFINKYFLRILLSYLTETIFLTVSIYKYMWFSRYDLHIVNPGLNIQTKPEPWNSISKTLCKFGKRFAWKACHFKTQKNAVTTL